jgi:LacI family transcriptional regulator
MSSISYPRFWTLTHPPGWDALSLDDLSRSCCQNPDCLLYGQRGSGNLTVCDRFGKQNQIRLLDCSGCKARFSERKGTPLIGCRLPNETAQAVLDHLAEGNGIRQTNRLVGVHRDTVVRLARAAGDHDHDAHEELMAFSPSDPRGPTRRGLVVRGKKADELRPGRSGR